VTDVESDSTRDWKQTPAGPNIALRNLQSLMGRREYLGHRNNVGRITYYIFELLNRWR
jgi:hypothetical protein